MCPPSFYIMKTIILDIDGTLTNMWPIEKSVILFMTDKKFEKAIEQVKLSGNSDTYRIFLKFSEQKISQKKYIVLYNQAFSILLKNNKLPVLKKYPLVKWISITRDKYRFVYATGGQQLEALYVLKNLGLIKYFDLENSISRTTCRFSKKTGIPFRIIKSKFEDCVLISDSKDDGRGAALAKIPFVLVKPK